MKFGFHKKEKEAPVVVEGAKEKKKLGLLSATSMVMIILLVVMANVAVSKLDWSFDLTDNKVFTISDQTKKIIKGLDKDVTIYFLSSKKNTNDQYLRIVNQYKKNSSHIKVKFRDMELYPNFAQEYVSSSVTVESNGILVVCGEKGSYIAESDFYSYTLDDSGNYVTAVNLEPKITSAINSVIAEKASVIYQLTGQGELDFDYSFQTSIEGDNYEFKELNLLTKKAVPKDCDILMIHAPKQDISDEAYQKVKKYMDQGGKLLYVCNTEAETLENFEKLLDSYGIGINDGLVIETNNGMYMQGYPTYLVPTIESTSITAAMASSQSYVLLPVSKGLTVTGDAATALLSTSEGAYSKTNLKSDTLQKEAGDIDGPFALAASSVDEDGATQVVVIGSQNMMVNEIDQYVSGGNTNFACNCVNSLAEQEDKIAIKAKELTEDTATYTNRAVMIISFVSVIGIPAVILLIGIAIMILRKKK